MVNDFPGASSYIDRHGRLRWRFQRKGKSRALPGDPAASPAYEDAYWAAVEGRPAPHAAVVRLPRAAEPRTIGAAWQAVLRTPEWGALASVSKAKRQSIAERFLCQPVAPGSPAWAGMPIADLRRRHVKGLLSDMADTPHAARHLLGVIRRMIAAAMDEEWIDVDPTYGIKWSPATKGYRAWTEAELAAYEIRHPVGTPARTAYAIALWMGNRRSDVAALRWDDLQDGEFRFRQGKTGRTMVLPVSDDLWAALLAVPEPLADTIANRSPKSLTGDMRKWCDQAGLSKECTLHGLRQTLGKMLAENDATTRQIMSALGHSTMQQATLYTRGADQAKMARDGMTKIVALRKKQT